MSKEFTRGDSHFCRTLKSEGRAVIPRKLTSVEGHAQFHGRR